MIDLLELHKYFILNHLKAGDTAVVRGVWGDVTLDNTFTIYSVTHTWDGRDHTATVVLEGGDFDA